MKQIFILSLVLAAFSSPPVAAQNIRNIQNILNIVHDADGADTQKKTAMKFERIRRWRLDPSKKDLKPGLRDWFEFELKELDDAVFSGAQNEVNVRLRLLKKVFLKKILSEFSETKTSGTSGDDANDALDLDLLTDNDLELDWLILKELSERLGKKKFSLLKDRHLESIVSAARSFESVVEESLGLNAGSQSNSSAETRLALLEKKRREAFQAKTELNRRKLERVRNRITQATLAGRGLTDAELIQDQVPVVISKQVARQENVPGIQKVFFNESRNQQFKAVWDGYESKSNLPLAPGAEVFVLTPMGATPAK